MQDTIEAKSREQHWYERLDRFLLYLLTCELAYYCVVMIAGILLFAINLNPRIPRGSQVILFAVAPYILVLPINIVGGLGSGVLNIRLKRQGYPGTGHLLNWVFLSATAWLFLVAVVFASSPFGGD